MLAYKGKQGQHQGEISAEVPFTSSRRMATVIANERGKQMAFSRGAPEVILGLSERIHDGGAEEEATDEALSQLGESGVNERAMQEAA